MQPHSKYTTCTWGSLELVLISSCEQLFMCPINRKGMIRQVDVACRFWIRQRDLFHFILVHSLVTLQYYNCVFTFQICLTYCQYMFGSKYTKRINIFHCSDWLLIDLLESVLLGSLFCHVSFFGCSFETLCWHSLHCQLNESTGTPQSFSLALWFCVGFPFLCRHDAIFSQDVRGFIGAAKALYKRNKPSYYQVNESM